MVALCWSGGYTTCCVSITCVCVGEGVTPEGLEGGGGLGRTVSDGGFQDATKAVGDGRALQVQLAHRRLCFAPPR